MGQSPIQLLWFAVATWDHVKKQCQILICPEWREDKGGLVW